MVNKNLLSGVGGLGLGLMNWLGNAQSNKNARAQNATTDKWGPMLALYTHGGGAPRVEVPKASFAKDMGPALVSALNSFASGGEDADGGGDMDPMLMAGGQGEGMSAGGGTDMFGSANGFPMLAAGGGEVPEYAGGGQVGSLMKLLPMLMGAGMSKGGRIPGRAMAPGDSPMNDTKLVATSPGEVVLPRTIAQEGMKGNHWKVAQYLGDVKKHGPGPMPIKKSAQPQPGKAKSSSMSPWAAMASGGKVGC